MEINTITPFYKNLDKTFLLQSNRKDFILYLVSVAEAVETARYPIDEYLINLGYNPVITVQQLLQFLKIHSNQLRKMDALPSLAFSNFLLSYPTYLRLLEYYESIFQIFLMYHEPLEEEEEEEYNLEIEKLEPSEFFTDRAPLDQEFHIEDFFNFLIIINYIGREGRDFGQEWFTTIFAEKQREKVEKKMN